MSARTVSAFAPATAANLGPGFDVLGLALDGPGDTVRVRKAAAGGPLVIEAIEGDGGRLPTAAHRNTAGVAARAALRKAGVDPDDCGLALSLEKGLPIGSGLGSSAASAAAAAYAVNAFIGGPLRRADLVGPCVEAEAVVAAAHADNVAPALLGGLVLVRSVEPLSLMRLPLPEGLRLVVVTPEIALETRAAREALPAQVPLTDMVHNAASLAAFVAACYAGDIGALGAAVSDVVVEPRRAALIPGGAQVMTAARAAGAVGTSICGAGPSIFAMTHSDAAAAQIGDAMVGAFAAAGHGASVFTAHADAPGARLVKS